MCIRDSRRGLGAEPVEADLGRLTPAAEHRERAAPIEHAWRQEHGFDALVSLEGDAAAQIEHVVLADVPPISSAQREAAAGIRAVEEGMDLDAAAEQRILDAVDDLFHLARSVRVAVSYTHLRAHETPEHLVC